MPFQLVDWPPQYYTTICQSAGRLVTGTDGYCAETANGENAAYSARAHLSMVLQSVLKRVRNSH
jgi:hypothetical protein